MFCQTITQQLFNKITLGFSNVTSIINHLYRKGEQTDYCFCDVLVTRTTIPPLHAHPTQEQTHKGPGDKSIT